MSDSNFRIGALASLDPNKTFPIDLTSPASVNGLILLGSLVAFAVGWAALAIVMYYVWGRKAPVLFPDNNPDEKKCIVDIEDAGREDHQRDLQQQTQITETPLTASIKTAVEVSDSVYVCAVCNASTTYNCPPSPPTSVPDDASSTASLHTAVEEDLQNDGGQCPSPQEAMRSIKINKQLANHNPARPDTERL